MPLEPAVAAHLAAGQLAGIDLTYPPTRRAVLTQEIDRMFRLFGLPGPEMSSIRDHGIRVEGGTITARVYHPGSAGPLPAHVFLHGGGWTTGTIDELVNDATARHRAAGADCVVVAVEYRLAPEHRFPTAVFDVVAAVGWVRQHADELGVDPCRISLGGASAGANLAAAAVVAQPALGLCGLILEVPALDLTDEVTVTPVDLGPEYADIPTEAEEFIGVREEYLGDHSLATSPLASPLRAPDLTGFPETHLFTGELDPLRASAEQFAVRLTAAGVPNSIRMYAGALHGSGILTATWPTARRWQDEVVETVAGLHAHARPTAATTAMRGL